MVLHVLAQTTSSGTGGFFGAIMPLLITTAVVGVVWVGLMYLIFQRAGERRRRKEMGLEPLPFAGRQFSEWAKNRFGSSATFPSTETGAETQAPVIYASAPAIPMPDLNHLTDDLPLPDMDALLSDTLSDEPTMEPPPAVIITPPPAPPVTTVAAAQPSASTTIAIPPQRQKLAEIPEDAVEIMRVMRDVEGGGLVIDMRGEIFDTLDGLDAKTRRRYENVIFELYRLAGEETLKTRFGANVSLTTSPETVSVPTPKKQSKTASTPAPNPEVPAAGGIAGPIEDLLQHRLAVHHPEWGNRSIHIHPAPDGGVIIEVDGLFYQAVGDVADSDIRGFLQQTISDWSNSHM